MKLTKKVLLAKNKEGLERLGYRELTDNITMADGLFIKQIEGGLFLSLGMIISKYYNVRFTASFYLSKSTIWGAVWGDIPRNSYMRIGHFLTEEERKRLLSDEFCKEGVVDAWWDAEDENAPEKFLDAVKISEDRFLDQKGLIVMIENSLEIATLEKMSKQVINQMLEPRSVSFDYKYIPKTAKGSITLDWLKAAERVLFYNQENLNKNTVARLAADAWRQNEFLHL